MMKGEGRRAKGEEPVVTELPAVADSPLGPLSPRPPVPSPLALGLDGGGTKTVCLLARLEEGGEPVVLGRGVGGPCNIHAVGAERARASLGEAIGRAFAAAGLPPGPVAVAAIGSAGVDRPGDRGVMTELLRSVVAAGRYAVVNDGAIALRAAVPEGPGVLIIAGTGSIGYGRDAAGREHRSGGWGYLLDDVGSAYIVGLSGLSAVLRAHDGRDGPTALSDALLGAWGLAAPDELIGRVYRLPPPREEIAALAPLVAAAARAGDGAAARIVAAAGEGLGELAAAVLAKIGARSHVDLPVVTDGGFFHAAADLLVPPFLDRLAREGYAVAHRMAAVEAAHGALALARETVERGA